MEASTESQASAEPRDGGPLRSLGVAVGLTILGLFGAELFTLPAFLADPRLVDAPGTATLEARTAMLVLNFVGMAAVGAIYLAVTDRGWSYVDLRVPTKRDALYAFAGIVAILGFYVLVSVLVQLLSLPSADNQVVDVIGGDETMVLIMIVVVFLFNAPAEEFLFRNVVQKRLYAAFGRLRAVLVASLIFAVVHFPAYMVLADSFLATLVSVCVIFGGGVIFGTVYAKTGNLLVPTIAHAVYNAALFGLLYLRLTSDLEGVEPAAPEFLEVVAVALPA